MFANGKMYQLSDFLPQEPEPVIEDEEDDAIQTVADDDLDDESEDGIVQAGAVDDSLDDDGEEDDTLYSDAEDDGEDEILSTEAEGDEEDGFSDGIISFSGLNLDELGITGNGDQLQTTDGTMDGLTEPYYPEDLDDDYLLDDGEWVDMELVGVQLLEDVPCGL